MAKNRMFVAVTYDGAEYMYRGYTAAYVARDRADTYCAALNAAGYMLNKPGEKWHVYTDDGNAPIWHEFRRRGNKLFLYDYMRPLNIW